MVVIIIYRVAFLFNSTTTGTTTAPYSPSSSSISSISSSSSMTVTVFFFLLLLLFTAFFSILARRFLVPPRHPTTPPPFFNHHHRPPSSLRRRYLPPYVGSSAAAAEGADPATLRSLPVLTYAERRRRIHRIEEELGTACVICLGELDGDEWVKVIPGCGHAFHPGCIDGWLLLHGSCPICRCSKLQLAGTGEVWVVDVRGGGAFGRSKSFGGSSSSSRSRSRRAAEEGEEEAPSLRRSCSHSGEMDHPTR